MREAIFILLVFAVVLALTAVRYRRQISAAIGFWKAIKASQKRFREMNDAAGGGKPVGSEDLVNCARCGRWVAGSDAVPYPPTSFVCKDACRPRVMPKM
jgi:hypothetical protein